MSSQYEFALRSPYPTFLLGSLFFGSVTVIAALYTISTIRKRNVWRFLEFAGFFVLFAVLTAFWALNFSNIWHLLFSSRSTGLDGALQIKLEQFLGPFALETIFFGSFCTLLVLACVVLVKRGLFKSRTHQFMLIVIVVMYIMSLVHWIFQAVSVPLNFDPNVGSTLDPEVTPLSLLTVNIILSDAIVLWRTWVIWKRVNWVLALSAVLLFVNFIVSLINIVKINESQHPLALSDTDVFGQPVFSGSSYGIAALCISFFSNVAATSLVGYKAWKYHREVRYASSSTPWVAKFFSLLVKSGSLYCVIWFLYVLSSATSVFGDPADNEDETTAPGVQWFNHLMPQLTGIYPTIIIVLALLEEAYGERLRTRSQPSSMFPLAVLTSPPPNETQGNGQITIGLDSGRFESKAGISAVPKDTKVIRSRRRIRFPNVPYERTIRRVRSQVSDDSLLLS